jgi:hypothetical protein
LAGLSGMYDLKEMPLPLEKEEKKNFIWKARFLAQDSVVDPHHFDVDPDAFADPGYQNYALQILMHNIESRSCYPYLK